jgi:hypothetical protein
LEDGKFISVETLRLQERIKQEEINFGTRAQKLGEIISSLKLGRHGAEKPFPTIDGAIYIPTVGNSNVVESVDKMIMKQQNYAQVIVDRDRSLPKFVAQFLNSELGRDVRERSKSGSVIPKLNTDGLRSLPVFLPPLIYNGRF